MRRCYIYLKRLTNKSSKQTPQRCLTTAVTITRLKNCKSIMLSNTIEIQNRKLNKNGLNIMNSMNTGIATALIKHRKETISNSRHSDSTLSRRSTRGVVDENIAVSDHIMAGPYKGSLVVNESATQYENYKTLVWLHGVDGTPEEFAVMFEEHAPSWMRVVLPKAPKRSITIRNNIVVPGWYDILTKKRDREDSDGIFSSEKIISKVLDNERKLLKENNNSGENLFLGGFSQGCAMTLHVAFHYKHQLGGIVGLGGYPLSTSDYPNYIRENPINKYTKLLVIHGNHDETVKLRWAKDRADDAFGFKKEHNTYEFLVIRGRDHEVYPEEIAHICKFVVNPRLYFGD